MTTAKEWFEQNGGIKNKETRELVMLLDSKDLQGTGYYMKILKRGRLIIQEAPYIKEWRRLVRRSKELRRKQNNGY